MNIADLFREFNVPYEEAGHRHVREGWIGVDCPDCSPGWEKYRLGFEIDTGRCNCWVCGRVDPVAAISSLLRIPTGQAVGIWKGIHRGWIPRDERKTGTLKLPESGELTAAHRKYLKQRNFDPDFIASFWGVGGIASSAELAWRLVIPIHDKTGKVVSWTTRAIRDGENVVRYVSAKPEQEAIHHKELLYGEHLARSSIVVVEGPISAWGGGPGFVATLGLVITPQQIASMVKYPIRAICFDATPDAQKRARKLCRLLSSCPGQTENIELETGKDTAEASRDEISEIRERYLFC